MFQWWVPYPPSKCVESLACVWGNGWRDTKALIKKWNCIISNCTTDVCVLSFMYLFSPAALHELERNNLSVIHPRPQNAAVSLSSAEVAVGILILACMIRIIIYSFCKVNKTRIQCIQNPEGAAFSHNVPFFLVFYSLLPLVLCERFHGLHIPIPEISLQLNGSLAGLLCFLDSPRIKYCTKWKSLYQIFFPYLNLTVNCIKVLRTIGLWGCVGMQGCLSTTKELCEKKWNK